MAPFNRKWIFGCILISLLAATWGAAGAEFTGGRASLSSPYLVAGFSGKNDQRDADFYPAIAFDPSLKRYLVVWLTPLNATSTSAGLDVYGIFLDASGRAQGSPFRISDQNTVSRNSSPAVAAGGGEFMVVWGKRGTPCTVYGQKIQSSTNLKDVQISSGTAGGHSPSLTYNPARSRYVLAYVEGADYLPPTFLGAPAADCGNDLASRSTIKALEFHWSGDGFTAGAPVAISDVNLGGFRPKVAYEPALSRYWIVWEDRRNAAGQPDRFGVFSQALDGNFALVGNDVMLSPDGSYTNDDSSSTWTPRPVLVAGESAFLAVWYGPPAAGGNNVKTWSIRASLIPSTNVPAAPFTVAQYTYAEKHLGKAPAGFLAGAYLPSTKEYVVGITSFMESLWGYHSFALIQRISSSGQLLNLEGNPMAGPGVGSSIDFTYEDKVAVGLAGNPAASMNSSAYLAVYSRHNANKAATDLDIYAVSISVPPVSQYTTALPLVLRDGP